MTLRPPIGAVGPALLEAAADRLYAEGASGVEYDDGKAAQAEWADEPLAPASQLFARAYFPDDDRWAARRERLAAWAQEAAIDMAASRVDEADWAEAWKQHYHPVRPGHRIWVVPAWEEAPDPQGLIIRIDPGMAFGTGTHATTSLMLALLEDIVWPGSRWLDVGTGSGILALGAWRLGASVFAVDVDPVAVDAARRNFAAHQAAIPLALGTVASLPRSLPPFDGMAANLTAAILCREMPALVPCLAPGGKLVLSGVIKDRWAEVAGALAAEGARVLEVRVRDGWVAAVASR